MQVNDAHFEVVEGDARNVLCEAVEKYHASILVVGSHGYGAIKRYISSQSYFPLIFEFEMSRIMSTIL